MGVKLRHYHDEGRVRRRNFKDINRRIKIFKQKNLFWTSPDYLLQPLKIFVFYM